MKFRDLFKPGRVRNRPYFAILSSFIFTLIAFFLSYLLFRSILSIATIFLTTMLLIPMMIHLLKMEERKASKHGIKNFFSNHKDIFEVYLYSFLGVFIAFVMIGLIMKQGTYAGLFDFQTRFLHAQEGVSAASIQEFVKSTIQPTLSQMISLFAHNLLVVVICFLLSFFYGASAIFLIILNGSVFASFIVFVIRTLSQNILSGLQALLFFMIHLLPEVSGFLLAAIAGGIVSKAISGENWRSKHFRNIFKDATVLVLIAIGLVLLGSVLETLVTTRLFQAFY